MAVGTSLPVLSSLAHFTGLKVYNHHRNNDYGPGVMNATHMGSCLPVKQRTSDKGRGLCLQQLQRHPM